MVTKHKTGSINEKRFVFTGTTELVSTDSGLLVVGKTYVIGQLCDDGLGNYDDFSNVGYVSEGTPFVATGTTPTVWTNGTPVHNLTDLPTLNVLDSNFENPITIGFWNNSGIIRPSLISMGEFTNNIIQLGGGVSARYIDANTINLNSIVPYGQPAMLLFYP